MNATKVDTAHYTYRVAWSPDDKEFVGTCLELPSLSWVAKSDVKALTGICKLVQDVVYEMLTSGERVPTPLVDDHCSGRFNIRISPDLHRELKIHAAERGMSLNRFVSDRLAHH